MVSQNNFQEKDEKQMSNTFSYNIATDIEFFAKDKTKIALIWENELGATKTITYRQLFNDANRFANALQKAGMKKGDTIVIILPRIPETYAIYLGALKLGLIISPGSEMLREADLLYRVKHSQAKAIVTTNVCTEVVDLVCRELNTNLLRIFISESDHNDWLKYSEFIENETSEFPAATAAEHDIAFLNYTSGTTGPPKGVLMHHGWAREHRDIVACKWMDIRETDIVWATASPGWAKWNWTPLVAVLGSGATGFVYDGKFCPNKYLQLIKSYAVNVLCCTPTEYRFMAKVDDLAQYQFPNLRSTVSAGEPLNRQVFDTFKHYFNVEVRDGYGQTENSLMIATLSNMDIKVGSMGKPTPGHKVEIIDEEGNVLPNGVVGNIAVYKDAGTLFKGYLYDDDRTKKAFIGPFYVTGDRAKKDEDGYLWFQGRSDDIIISSGYTIGPYEVEDALIRHDDVKECAVVSSPDELRGYVVKAFVVLQDGVRADNEQVKKLQSFVKEQTAPYKYPRKMEFVSSLPKTVSGKIRRVELRDQEYAKFNNC